MTEAAKTTFDLLGEHAPRGYALGSGLTVPRPIGWIGTISADGVPNLAPYSFFNMVAPTPPTFVVSPGLGTRKDTLRNLEDTGEFTINIVTVDTVEAMNASSATFPAEVDEFEAVGLTAVTSGRCSAPRVGEAVANFECRVVQMVPVGEASADRPGTAMLVIGEAHTVLIDQKVLDGDQRVDQHRLRAVGRHAGSWYTDTAAALFELVRPE